MALCLNSTKNIFTSPTPWSYQASPKPYEQSRFLTLLTQFTIVWYFVSALNCTLYKTFVRRVCFIFKKFSQYFTILIYLWTINGIRPSSPYIISFIFTKVFMYFFYCFSGIKSPYFATIWKHRHHHFIKKITTEFIFTNRFSLLRKLNIALRPFLANINCVCVNEPA